ncbi:MAG TPA: TonB-dependent receptor [Micropepsaceae bacterium]|nr:TonB-dependent receptor [Micropepsaceae bacterium]
MCNKISRFCAAAPLALIAAQASAQSGAPPPETVTVIATSPLPGTGIDVDRLPNVTETVSGADLQREGIANTAGTLNEELGDININDNLDDPYQPDILFRGFEASPVLGTPAGLAVYQNGVRINEGFGDTLNWDLIPDPAVDRIDLVSANPVYGLNALGGAVIVTMKNGFSFAGVQADASGGSWGQRQGSVQFGANDGTFGIYVAARALNEDGWRRFSPDSLRQIYSDLAYRSGGLVADLSFTAADNHLSGESATPVQELAVGRSLTFTSPQSTINRLQFVALNANYDAGGAWSVQGNAYYRVFHQSVTNGNTTNYTACALPQFAGLLCQGDATTPLADQSGAAIPDLSQAGAVPIGEVDFENVTTKSLGGTIQFADAGALIGHDNQLTFGASLDSNAVRFGSSAELGTINPELVVDHTGIFVATPEGTPFTATPVGLNAASNYYGLYVTDTFNVSEDFAVTASGRYNIADIDLTDLRGSALTGKSRYSRFNPAIGFAWKVTGALTAFGGYSEGNRAPTPAEIECSSPTAPCLLPSSLSSDPPNLRQVVSRTYEAGLRGRLAADDFSGGVVTWNASLFRTDVDDDIYGVATSLSTGYFQNIGGTRREGGEIGLNYRNDRLHAYADYSYVAATFRAAFLLPSPLNPGADANGDIQVRSGDMLPGIPAHRVKLGADYIVTENWAIGATVTFESSQYFRGDESNQMKPLPGFAVLGLHTTYALTDWLSVFANIANATDARYATFGVLGDPTGIGAPGVRVPVDYRFESPATPFSLFAGLRVRN